MYCCKHSAGPWLLMHSLLMIILLPVLVVRDSISGLDKRYRRISIESYPESISCKVDFQSKKKKKLNHSSNNNGSNNGSNNFANLDNLELTDTWILDGLLGDDYPNFVFQKEKEFTSFLDSIGNDITNARLYFLKSLLLSRVFTLGWSQFFQDSVSTIWKRYYIYIHGRGGREMRKFGRPFIWPRDY